jgi:hypothetical protein
MDRRTFIGGLVATSYVTAVRAQVWLLVTEEEFKRELSAPQIPQAPTSVQPDAPVISVDQPDTSKPVKTPVSIRIGFHPQGAATINLSSLRITYGFFAIPITDRILQHAQLTSTGLSADDAQLPSGHHKVTLQIADNLGRVGMRTLDFTVA